jgi:hypothetical protein
MLEFFPSAERVGGHVNPPKAREQMKITTAETVVPAIKVTKTGRSPH